MFLRHKEEAIFTGINLNRTNRCHYDALYSHSADICVWINSPMHEWDCSHTGYVSRDWKFCPLSSWKPLFLKQFSSSIVAWHLFSDRTAKCPLSMWYRLLSILLEAGTLSISSLFPHCMFLFSFYHTKIVPACLCSPYFVHDWLQAWQWICSAKDIVYSPGKTILFQNEHVFTKTHVIQPSDVQCSAQMQFIYKSHLLTLNNESVSCALAKNKWPCFPVDCFGP